MPKLVDILSKSVYSRLLEPNLLALFWFAHPPNSTFSFHASRSFSLSLSMQSVPGIEERRVYKAAVPMLYMLRFVCTNTLHRCSFHSSYIPTAQEIPGCPSKHELTRSPFYIVYATIAHVRTYILI